MSGTGQRHGRLQYSLNSICYGEAPPGSSGYFALSTELSSLPTRNAPSGVSAGIVIAVCAGLAIVAIAHHPTVTPRTPAETLAAVVALGPADRIVHGSLIFIMSALMYGLSVFALRQGLHQATALSGVLAYAAGVGALIGAALIDGFVVPDVASLYAGASLENVKVAQQLLALCALCIQVLSKFGLVAESIAIAAWSIGLVRMAGAPRAAGIIGVVAGVLPAVFLLGGGVHLTPQSLLALVTVQAIWYLAIGALLIRRTL